MGLVWPWPFQQAAHAQVRPVFLAICFSSSVRQLYFLMKQNGAAADLCIIDYVLDPVVLSYVSIALIGLGRSGRAGP